METQTWTQEWPTELGYYWLYGWCFKDHRPAKYNFVEVRRFSFGTLAYIANGHLLYKGQGASGHWQKVDFPKSPKGL